MMPEFTDLFGGSRWLIEPSAMRALLARAAAATPESIQAAIAGYADRPTTPPTLVGDVAVINMTGPIVYRASWMSMYFGFATIETMRDQFRAALADPAVRAILWRCHSPGGIVDMMPEFADEIFAARGQKPITFVADTLIASCAYWLACQGDQIIAPRSALIGAIGTYIEHKDVSQMLEKAGIKITILQHGDRKTDGNPYEPLSAEAAADLQAYVDEVGEEFETAVARGRGVTKKVVVDTFGQGRVFRGKQAIALGLADKLSTFDQVLTKLTKGRSARADVASPIAGSLSAQDEPLTAVASADAPVVAGKTPKADEGIDPQDDGTCPDGYSKADDGLCYLDTGSDDGGVEAKAIAVRQAAADRDLTETTLALTDLR